ncbi:hypothetical protein, partial [Paraburkholderia sabiae]
QLWRAKALSWRAPEVQKRLSFAYFSLPLQRKVGAAPHRGNARSTDTKPRTPPKAAKNPHKPGHTVARQKHP